MARPKKLKEEDYKTVEKLAKTGLTKEMIADFLDYSYSTMYEDKMFSEAYKKGYAVVGAKVRTVLLSKIDHDTTANIYLDKVINKTSEKYQDEMIDIKRKQLANDKGTDDRVIEVLDRIGKNLK